MEECVLEWVVRIAHNQLSAQIEQLPHTSPSPEVVGTAAMTHEDGIAACHRPRHSADSGLVAGAGWGWPAGAGALLDGSAWLKCHWLVARSRGSGFLDAGQFAGCMVHGAWYWFTSTFLPKTLQLQETSPCMYDIVLICPRKPTGHTYVTLAMRPREL
jgi:hypothetical protein